MPTLPRGGGVGGELLKGLLSLENRGLATGTWASWEGCVAERPHAGPREMGAECRPPFPSVERLTVVWPVHSFSLKTTVCRQVRPCDVAWNVGLPWRCWVAVRAGAVEDRCGCRRAARPSEAPTERVRRRWCPGGYS